VRVTGVLPAMRLTNMEGALMSYHSLREKGSAAFFFVDLPPFLPNFLFFPTATAERRRGGEEGRVRRCVRGAGRRVIGTGGRARTHHSHSARARGSKSAT